MALSFERRACLIVLAATLGGLGCTLVRDLDDLRTECPARCAGGPCVGDECTPFAIADGRSQAGPLVVAPAGVFWAEHDTDEDEKGRIMKLLPDGGAQLLVTSEVRATALAVFEDHVYWLAADDLGSPSTGMIGRCPVVRENACSATLDPVGATPADALLVNDTPQGRDAEGLLVAGTGEIVVDGSGLYWTNDPPRSDGAVLFCAAPPCARDAVRSFATTQIAPSAMAHDATHVYWVNRNSYDALDQGAVMRAPKGASAIPVAVATNLKSPQKIAVFGDRIYITSLGGDGGGAVMSAAVGGGDVRVFAAAEPDPFAIAADASGVYWTLKTASGSVRMCPLSGCEGGVRVLASAQAQPTGIALDAVAVYWTNADPKGAVMKTGKPRPP